MTKCCFTKRDKKAQYVDPINNLCIFFSYLSFFALYSENFIDKSGIETTLDKMKMNVNIQNQKFKVKI